MARLKLKLFAALKDHFNEDIELELSDLSLAEIKNLLATQAPEARALLSSCRFAVNDEFVNHNHVFSENDHVLILPPSSGG